MLSRAEIVLGRDDPTPEPYEIVPDFINTVPRCDNYSQTSLPHEMEESGNLSWVWDETFWFPPDRPWGWKDLKNVAGSNVYLPQVEDLHWSILLGIVLIGVRYLLEM